MRHLTTSIWEGLASLGFATMLMWAPVFGSPMFDGGSEERGRTISRPISADAH
jgi:hypothetical protein